jgi:hypothetical protein
MHDGADRAAVMVVVRMVAVIMIARRVLRGRLPLRGRGIGGGKSIGLEVFGVDVAERQRELQAERE